MRTTINIDDDVIEEAKKVAENRSVSLGRAVSDLVRRGLTAPVQTEVVNGLHIIVLPSESPKVDSRRVKTLLEDEMD